MPKTATSIHVWLPGPDVSPKVDVCGSVWLLLADVLDSPDWLPVKDDDDETDELDDSAELEDAELELEEADELELEDSAELEDAEELELDDAELEDADDELEDADDELELEDDCWPSAQFREYVLLDEIAVPVPGPV
jgi:hypothetical protein